ncbi:MAG: DUF3293 domain-containing protein [Pseudomonadota bacterium]
MERLTPELVSAYRAAIYRVCHEPPFELKVDERSASLSAWLRQSDFETAALITAANPASRSLPDSENQQRHANLLASLVGRSFLEGENLDPAGQWPAERSVLIAGMGQEQARVLARQWGQNAWLQIDSDAIPRLFLVGNE